MSPVRPDGSASVNFSPTRKPTTANTVAPNASAQAARAGMTTPANAKASTAASVLGLAPTIRVRTGSDGRGADQSVAGDQLGQLRFVRALRGQGPPWQHQVPCFGARIPDANFRACRKVQAELEQHRSRVADD